MTPEADRRAAFEELDGIVDRGGDADDVLREALAVLERLLGWAAIRFVDEGELVPGPSAGARPDGAGGRRAPVVFGGMTVAELEAPAGDEDAAFLDRVALLLAPYCLVGWDTGGEDWEP